METGKQGTLHLQFVVTYKIPQRLSFLQKMFPGVHGEVPLSVGAARNYCRKSETRTDGPWDFGSVGGLTTKLTASAALALTEEECRELSLQQYIAVQKCKQIAASKEPRVRFDAANPPGTRGVWIVGASGAGKSFLVRSLCHPLAEKPQSKWWDGWRPDDDYVMLDDFDKSGACLSHYLKRWSDGYDHTGEVKGAHVQPRYFLFIITSQYEIEEIFHEDSKVADAIKRRFEVIRIDDGL